jgi:hypothetical protein
LHPDDYSLIVDKLTFMDFYDYCRETQFDSPEARTDLHRGFKSVGPKSRSLEDMADLWDAARMGREQSWWPLPPGW